MINDSGHILDPSDPEKIPVQPVVNELQCDSLPLCNTILSQPGDLFMKLSQVLAGMSFNVTNSYAAAYLLSIGGVEGVILSSECTDINISLLLEAFKKRYGFVLPAYRLVYGRRDLMIIRDYHVSGSYLEDLQNRLYPVIEEGITTRILEPEPFISDNPNCPGSYIIFTIEDRNQSKAIKEEAYEEISERLFGRI